MRMLEELSENSDLVRTKRLLGVPDALRLLVTSLSRGRSFCDDVMSMLARFRSPPVEEIATELKIPVRPVGLREV